MDYLDPNGRCPRIYVVEPISSNESDQSGLVDGSNFLFQGHDIVPIPGTKRRKYLEENVDALDVQLTTEDMRQIDEGFPYGAASGLRYPEHMMAIVNG